MARRSSAVRALPPPPQSEEATARAVAEAVARELAAEEPSIEELKGTTGLLDKLEMLGTTERARYGFRFRVVLAEGARAFLPDSDWGETVPTPAAIADRYGPGSYVVQVGQRRNGRGGGWGPEIAVRIAPPRSPDRPAPVSGGADSRIFDLFERLVVSRAEREDAVAAAAPARDVVTREELEARVSAALQAGDRDGLSQLLAHPASLQLIKSLLAPGTPDAPAAPAEGSEA